MASEAPANLFRDRAEGVAAHTAPGDRRRRCTVHSTAVARHRGFVRMARGRPLLFPFLFNVLAGLLVTLVEAPFCCNCIKCCVDCAERITCLKSGTLRAPIFSCLCGLGLYLDLTMNQSAFFVITHIALGVSGGLYVASACFSKEGEDYSMVDGETKV